MAFDRCFLKEARKKSGLTQTEAAAALKISMQTYWRYENGEKTPPIETALAMADLFHVPASSLLGMAKTSSEAILISKIGNLSPEDRKTVEELVDRLSK